MGTFKAANVGERVHQTLLADERTVSWLARTAGFSYTTLLRRLADPGTFQVHELERVAQALNVDPAWLQTGLEVAA